jgi:hypothetical protein
MIEQQQVSPAAPLCTFPGDRSVGHISWNESKQKYDLLADGEVVVSSKDKGYLNYLVVKQKHSAIIQAGLKSTQIVLDKTPMPIVMPSKADVESMGISLGTWDALVTELHPYVAAGIMPEVVPPKTKGRPRKYFPEVVNKRTHTLGDSEPDLRNLLPMTERKIILDFREYLEEGKTPKQALDFICDLYKITYFQAFGICEKEY